MGCSGSKAGQPKTKGLDGKSLASLHVSPNTNRPNLKVKEVPEEILKKHKVEDIMRFVKQGQLHMVNGLEKYFNLGINILKLRNSEDDMVHIDSKHRISSKDWNPLLVAIAFKRPELVRYFVEYLRLSVR